MLQFNTALQLLHRMVSTSMLLQPCRAHSNADSANGFANHVWNCVT